MTSPPTEKVRISVPVTPEVHAAFQRLAQASGMSTSKAMGEWLADTLDAVQYMADKVHEARSAPRKVAMELHAYALGAAEMTGGFLSEVRDKARADEATKRSSAGTRAAPPRPVIRGGNSGRKTS
jgi:hypothetical protein